MSIIQDPSQGVADPGTALLMRRRGILPPPGPADSDSSPSSNDAAPPPPPQSTTAPTPTGVPGPGKAPMAAPPPQSNGGGVGGFFASLGQHLKKVMPYITPIANRLAAAAGNYGPIELEHQQRQQQMEQDRLTLQQQLQQSQMQTAELNRQLLQKQVENSRTPEEAEAIRVKQAGEEEAAKVQNAAPTDIVAPMDSGGMGHYNRSYNPQTKQWEVKPTMVGGGTVPNPTQAPNAGMAPPTMPPLVKPSPTVEQAPHQLPALSKPASAAGDIEPDSRSQTGFSRIWRDAGLNEIHRVDAPAPFAYVPQQTTSTVEQTGPTGLHEVNTTTTTKQPAGAGAPKPKAPPTKPPVPTAFNVSGPEAQKMMDQDVALKQTSDLIANVRANKQLFASMLDGGKIQIGSDPNSGFFGKIVSRNLTPEEAKLAGNVQSLMEHINTVRLALSAQGFRGEEAWNALQAQRGNLLQHPEQIDTTLGNTLKVVTGLMKNHRKLLGPAAPQDNSTSGGFTHF